MHVDDADLSSALPPAARDRVQSARLRGGIASVVLDVAGLARGDRAALAASVEAALTARGDVREARVALVAARAPAASERRLIAVGSGKGGVGKSTLAANLAVALARGGSNRQGRRVGLVDADIHGPSLPRLMGSEGARAAAHEGKLVPVAGAWGVPLLSVGQLVDPGEPIAWRGPMAAGALGRLIDANWGEAGRGGADLLVIDLPPGTGDVQLTMLQRFTPVGAVIVTTPQDLALADARRAIALFAKGAVPVIGLVENMAGYACPHCGEISDPFGRGGAEAAARSLGLPFLGRIPLTLAIRAASDAGEPPAAGEGDDADAFAAIAAQVSAWLDREVA